MRELEIGGQIVNLNFGMKFLKDINKSITVPVDGIPNLKENVGLKYIVGQMMEGDVEALSNVIFTANAGCDPRFTRDAIDNLIESDDTNIDKVFDDIMGFLKTSNPTKKATVTAAENWKRAQEIQEKKLEMQMDAMM